MSPTEPLPHPSPRGTSARILLVDDHTMVREGIRRILEGGPQGWRCTEASSGYGALQALSVDRFDAVLVDLSMPGMAGMDLIARIRRDRATLPILVLSMHAEQEYALRAFRAGANGYLTKDGAAGELVQAVEKVLAGRVYVTPSLAEQVVLQLNRGAAHAPHALLSDRELEVMRRLVDGQRAADIAEALHLSPKTISSHKTNLMHKLGVDSMAALVRYAMTHGLHPDAATEPVERVRGWSSESGPGDL